MLQVVIMGCGQIAGGYDLNSAADMYTTHVKAYRAFEAVSVAAAYDPDTERLQQFQQQWGIPRVYADPADMLHDIKPDIASICSPNPYHFEQIRLCADQGVKLIFCEKPLALNSREVEEAIVYCQERNVKLVVNYLRTWDPCFNQLVQNIQEEQQALQSIHVHYNKGVLHNASHFIHLFSRCLGAFKGFQVFSKSALQQDAIADFMLSFEGCDKVYFFNHTGADIQLTELEIYFRHKRIRIERGGMQFFTHDYQSGLVHETAGTIGACMKYVVSDLVAHIQDAQPPAHWQALLHHTLISTKICEKIINH